MQYLCIVHVYMYTCTCTHVHVHMCMYTCACTHVHVHMYTCVLRVHVHVGTIMQYLCIVHVYMYTCACTHVHVHMCMYTHSIPFTHSLTGVPFVRGHRSVFPRIPRNTGVYTRHSTFVTATSGVLTRLPAWLSKNRMRVYTLSDMRSKKNFVYTRPPKRRG